MGLAVLVSVQHAPVFRANAMPDVDASKANEEAAALASAVQSALIHSTRVTKLRGECIDDVLIVQCY
jgi:hypothetical protein